METKEILKSLRKKSGYDNAKAFCENIGISYNTYQNYESGKRIPQADVLIKLADFYHVTTDYLLGRPDPSELDPIESVARVYRLTSAQKGILAAYLYMNEADRDTLLNIVKRLAEGAEAPEQAGETCEYETYTAEEYQQLREAKGKEAVG